MLDTEVMKQELTESDDVSELEKLLLDFENNLPSSFLETLLKERQ